MLALKFLGKMREVGFLILRVGIGLSFIMHGSGKIFAGPEMWTQVGQAMGNWGVNVAPMFWGFMAAFAEFGGGILMILGFLFRPAMILMFVTMAVATTMHYKKGDPFNVYSHSLELGILFLSLIFIGPGRISIDKE